MNLHKNYNYMFFFLNKTISFENDLLYLELFIKIFNKYIFYIINIMDIYSLSGNLKVDGYNINIQDEFTVDPSGNIIGENLYLRGNLIVKQIPYIFLHRTTSLDINRNIITKIYYDTIEFDETFMRFNDVSSLFIDNTNCLLYQNILDINQNNSANINQVVQDISGNFLIQLNGLYSIETQITFSNNDVVGNTGNVYLYLYRNNNTNDSQLIYSRMWKKFVNSETNTLSLNATVKLKKDDTISICIKQDASTSMQSGILFHPCWVIIRFVG